MQHSSSQQICSAQPGVQIEEESIKPSPTNERVLKDSISVLRNSMDCAEGEEAQEKDELETAFIAETRTCVASLTSFGVIVVVFGFVGGGCTAFAFTLRSDGNSNEENSGVGNEG